MRGSVVDCIEVNIDFAECIFINEIGLTDCIAVIIEFSSLLKCLLQKKRKINTILRKESRNMRLSIECKTLFVSVWDAVMKLTAVGKYYFSSDIRNFKNITPPPPPPPYFLYCLQFLRTSACVCRTSENCKSLVLQGECNIEIFLSPDNTSHQCQSIVVLLADAAYI